MDHHEIEYGGLGSMHTGKNTNPWPTPIDTTVSFGIKFIMCAIL